MNSGIKNPIFFLLKILSIFSYLTFTLPSLRSTLEALRILIVDAAAHVAHLNVLLASEDALKGFSASPHSLRLTFSVSRIKCSACAWKIESFLQNQPHFSDWNINIPQSTLSITLSDWTKAATLVSDLKKLGFDAVPVRSNEEAQNAQDREFKKELFRLVVAAFSAGNIMSLSLSNYFGASDHFRFLFDVISLGLLLPALLYSAYPYYRGFWATLKTGVPSLEFPIALALFGGAILSTINLFTGTGDVYYDSISGLILFLLTSRFVLNRLMEKFLRTGTLSLPGVDFVREIQGGQERILSAQQVRVDQTYSVHPGETIPCDGVLLSESALVNTSIITGEPYAQSISKNTPLIAGSTVIGSPLLMRSTSTTHTSRFGQWLSSLEQNDFRKLPHAHIVDKWAMWFSYAVLAVGTALFIYWWPIDPRTGLSRVLALFMTSCPCALTFGFPLIMSLSIKQAQKLGLVVQDVSAIPKLSSVQHVFLDKTGTVTSEELDLLTNLENQFAPEDLKAILALELHSHHPIAQALRRNLDLSPLPTVIDFRYNPTIGISGVVNNHFYELKTNLQNKENLSVLVIKDRQSLGSIEFREHIRSSARVAVTQLQKRGLKVHLLSGDSVNAVQKVASELQTDGPDYAEQSPEQKQTLIEKTPHTLMIGDGINDAASLKIATVGIAMPGPIEKLNSVAPLLFSQPRLESLPTLFELAHFTQTATRRLAYLSFSYNLIISCMAIAGYIHPLLAAILMPLSSLAVIGLVLITHKEMQWKLSSY